MGSEDGSEPGKKSEECERKIKRTVEGMIDQMKMTEAEINYRIENFDNVDVFKDYLKYLKCTKCGLNFQKVINKGEKVGVHPLLGVLMCNKCCDYYGDGNFSMDSDGEDKYCRWCGEGGTIFACSTCICGFCDRCIKKHFGEDGLEKVEKDDDWVCYFCDSKPLWKLRSICSLAEQAAKTRREQVKKEKKNREMRRENENEAGKTDTSSDHGSSTTNDTDNRRSKRKRFSKVKDHASIRSDSSSAFDEVLNHLSRKRSRRKTKRRSCRRKQSEEKSEKEESTGSDGTIPQKKAKTKDDDGNEEGENREEKNGNEKDGFGSKKNVALDKLRGVWRLTQIAAEVGLGTSKDRLKKLSNPEIFQSMDGLHKEFQCLESLLSVLWSSVNTARNSIESITKDFTLENVKDERDIFQSQEKEIKKIGKKLKKDYEESDSDTNSNVLNTRRKRREEEEKKTKEEKSKEDSCISQMSKKDQDSVIFDGSEGGKEKVEEPEVTSARKPMLKVKSFAKMLAKNAYRQNVKVEIVGIDPESPIKKSDKNFKEYNVETDTDKEKETDKESDRDKEKGKDENEEIILENDGKFEVDVNKDKNERVESHVGISGKRSQRTESNTKKGENSDICTTMKIDVGSEKDIERNKNKSQEKNRDWNVIEDKEASTNLNLDKKKEENTDSRTEANKSEEDGGGTEKDDDEEMIKKRTRKKRKLKPSSGSNFSDEIEGGLRSAARKSKKEKEKMKASFEKFRQKREKFLKSGTSKIKKNEKTNEAKEKNSHSADEDGIEKKKRFGKQRKQLLFSSDEEEQREIKDVSETSEDEKNSKESSDEEVEGRTNDSDASERLAKISSAETSSDDMVGQKSKNKRKKKVETSSSGSSCEEELNKKKKKKNSRKNIKKILKKDSLQVETKEALKNEEARKKRLEERRKLFQEIFSDSKDENAPKRLILDFDPKTKKPLVAVHKKLVKQLKPHQMEGVKFMWDNCFESVQRLDEDSGSGCILAHCMGLGKTLQVVTLVHTVLTHDLGVNTVLIVSPLNTVSNWIHEFEMWLSNVHTEPITLYELVKYRKLEERCFHLKDWQENGGVLVISYDLFRTLTKALMKKKAKRKSKSVQTVEAAFFDPGPDLVICDEGHLLKNEDTVLSKCLNMIKTARRIVLTGTPLQNNLIEYHCMVQFVKPNILGTKKEFSNRFVNPITNGQFEDSTDFDVKIMKRRSHVLHSMLDGCVQRFDYSVLAPFLPEKQEYVLAISLTETQAKAYKFFINTFSGRAVGGSKAAKMFQDYHNLQRIWTHPRTMLMHSEKNVLKETNDSEGSLKDFVVGTDESTDEDSSNVSSGSSVVEVTPRKRILRSNANNPEMFEEEEEEEKSPTKHWWNDFFQENEYEDIRASNKLIILFSLLKRCGEIKDKVLVFSQSLYSLDLIEYFLNKISENDGKDELLSGHQGTWHLGSDYFRLDGSTSSDLRTRWCRHFNKESNERARLFLISTRAGGLGINLYGANRVVIFDASWNPSHDLQSIFRVYRFGQKKTCYIYRFLAEATMEEKIYERQVTKLSLAHRVVDEYQIERHYSMMNLQELYNYQPIPKEQRKVPKLPKDNVFADILAAHKDAIVSYHEHDSLLENREEEELSEEERKAAWQEYEDEKTQKAKTFDVAAFQQMQAAMAQVQAQTPVQVQSQILNNVPLHFVNPNFVPMNPGMAGQSVLNPLAIHPLIPLNILQRGLQLGIAPLFNENSECFLGRVSARERWMQMDRGPRET